jgi:hypothetical protein
MADEQLRFIAVGDHVRVAASAPGRRDAFDAVVHAVDGDSITVYGGKPGRERWRTVAAQRIEPRRRTRPR